MKQNIKKHYFDTSLTSGMVWKKLLIFFLPIAAGTIIQQLYNTVDAFIVSKFVGTEALAAVGGSTSQIINVLIGFFVSVTAGAAVIIAQLYGAEKLNEVKRAAGSALTMCVILGAGLSVIGLVFTPQLLELMNTPADTMEDAITYLRICFAGDIFVLVLNMESNMLRSVGDSRTPFIFMIISCVTNIVLDYIFVRFFDWGVMGVAIATVFSQMVNMVLLTLHLFKKDTEYRLRISDLALNKNFLRKMAAVGIPSGLQSSMYAVSNMIIQIGVNSIGTVAVASWSLSGKIDGFYWAITSALGIAITSFVGQNYGANKPDRVHSCAKQGFFISSAITVLLSVVILAVSRPALILLTDDPAVREVTYDVLWFFVPYYILWTVIEVFSGILKGMGDAVRPVVITGLGICLLRILWIAFIFPLDRTIAMLCYSYVVSWSVTAAALAVYYLKHSRRLLKLT